MKNKQYTVSTSTHGWTAGNHPKHEQITVNGYRSIKTENTTLGQQIKIVREDGSTIDIDLLR